MISFEEAFDTIMARVSLAGTTTASLADLANRVLAQDILSPIDLPIFTNSAVDGFALRSSDTKAGPTKLKIVASVPAGTAPKVELRSGEAARVFTGSPLPINADAIAMQEYVTATEDSLEVQHPVERGEFVRERGEEKRKGDVVLCANTIVTPAVLSTLATLGLSEAIVYKKPRVAIIGTGSELVSAGQELQLGQIYESNSQALAVAARLAGANVGFVATVGDDPTEIEQALSASLKDHDVIVTCGGVSVGEHDYVRECATKLGVQEVFWRIAMRPGRPVYFGVGPKGQLVFGLPGNPVSALVTYLLFVRPTLLKMVGQDASHRFVDASVSETIYKQKGRADFVRAAAVGGDNLTLNPTEGQSSHMLSGLAGAQYLIYTSADAESVPTGSTVRALPIEWSLCS